MQILKCFKERNDIEGWNIFGRTESSFCQAVNIRYVLRAGSKRNDVAPQGLLAVPTLNSRYRPERVEHLDRHWRSEEHTSELQSRGHLVCRLLLVKKKPDY